MCKYCNGTESIFYNRESEGIREVVIELDGSLSINYCPMCGEKLIKR